MIDSLTLSQSFAALSHPSRVDVFKCLLARFPDGLRFGELSKATGLPPSTLTHHLEEMASGGLIRRTPQGRSTLISLELERLQSIIGTLNQICCSAQEKDKDQRS